MYLSYFRRINIAVAAGLVLGFVSVPANSETWRAYTYDTVSTLPASRGLIEMIETIEEKTESALEVDLFLSGVLPIRGSDIAPAVSDNVVQVALDYFFTGHIPIGGAIRIPFMIADFDEFERAEEILMPYLVEAYGTLGIEIIGKVKYPAASFFSSKPLTSLEDLQGMKIRATSAEQAATIERLGGIPVTLAPNEVSAALERGVIDGALSISGTVSRVWADLLQYRYELPTAYQNAYIIVNKAAFEALPADVQSVVKTAGAEAGASITSAIFKEDEEMTQKLIDERGYTNTVADKETLTKARSKFLEYWDEWGSKRGPKTVEAVAEIRAAIGK